MQMGVGKGLWKQDDTDGRMRSLKIKNVYFCVLYSSHLFSIFNVAVCKDPPYKVEESGYAGFILPIEVYFKNKVCNLCPLIFQ